MKNIDKIRIMTTKELVEFILNPCVSCDECCTQHSIKCKDNLIQWLEQESEE